MKETVDKVWHKCGKSGIMDHPIQKVDGSSVVLLETNLDSSAFLALRVSDLDLKDFYLLHPQVLFTTLELHATWSRDEKAVCLSEKCVDCDKTEERSVQIFIPYERSLSLVFGEEEWLVGATPST